ncbi:type II toxin-antitoxin system YafQ family toxin [Segatella sinensis]|uniref:Type II toxin-antitoxin system YafQ family toxin n=1 Tax=Segatella sinensis TaxID=3085167 RepID=A0ABV1G2F9_9BACT
MEKAINDWNQNRIQYAVLNSESRIFSFCGISECHITPDWLMLWEQNDEKLTLLFLNNGTHSDLF